MGPRAVPTTYWVQVQVQVQVWVDLVEAKRSIFCPYVVYWEN